MSTDIEQALMLAAAQQPVSTAIEADQCSFKSCSSGVLIASRGVRTPQLATMVAMRFQGLLDDCSRWRTLSQRSRPRESVVVAAHYHPCLQLVIPAHLLPLSSALVTVLSCALDHPTNTIVLAQDASLKRHVTPSTLDRTISIAHV